MALKVYVDRMSQPCRAVLIFCKINGIDFEEIRIDIFKKHQFSPEYKAIVDGRFKLFESHAIMIYISCAFPRVASHWYPCDVSKRAKIHSVLDWHHSNLRLGTACTQEEVNNVMELSKIAQKPWAKTPLWKRAELLQKTATILKEHKAPIAECLVKEVAKPAN